MDLDYQMMTELTAIELNLEELKVGYKKKYFRKDLIKAWSIKCHHCEIKVSSNEADEYFIVYLPWKEGLGLRFCSKSCSDICYNEVRNELLANRERINKEREMLLKFYKEAEEKFEKEKQKIEILQNYK